VEVVTEVMPEMRVATAKVVAGEATEVKMVASRVMPAMRVATMKVVASRVVATKAFAVVGKVMAMEMT